MNRKTLPLLALGAVLGLAAGLLVTGLPPLAAEPPAQGASPFKNVKVLTHVTTKAEMRKLMKEQAAALGVKCTHCHVAGKFNLDDKEEKQQAREMLRMVSDLNGRWFKDPEGPKVSCWTCHRGSDEPETEIPAALLATGPDTFEAETPTPP